MIGLNEAVKKAAHRRKITVAALLSEVGLKPRSYYYFLSGRSLTTPNYVRILKLRKKCGLSTDISDEN